MDREELARVDDYLNDAMGELQPLVYNPQRRAAWEAIQRARQRLKRFLGPEPQRDGQVSRGGRR